MPNLNLMAPCNFLGYGTVGYNLLIRLARHFDIAYWPKGQIEYPVPQELASIIQKAIGRQSNFDYSAPCLKIWHQHDMAEVVGRGVLMGMPIFELDNFTSREKHHLEYLDKIFVCSKWAKEVVCSTTNVDCNHVKVTPLGVDRTIFYDERPIDVGPTVFLNIGKWEIRKGHDVLIDAFREAFRKDDKVELWMMNHNPFLSPEQEKTWIEYYTKGELGDKVKILPRVQTQQELSQIMRRAHCGVFPARAEGWNLELLEMMSCGREVITTNYSAHTEFANEENSWLIDIDELEPAFDGIWFDGNVGNWAKLGSQQISQIAGSMRDLHLLRGSSFGTMENKAGVDTAERYSWTNTADLIFEFTKGYCCKNEKDF